MKLISLQTPNVLGFSVFFFSLFDYFTCSKFFSLWDDLLIVLGLWPLVFSDHHGEHHHHDHVHDSAVSSVSIVSEGTMDLDEVSGNSSTWIYELSVCAPMHVWAKEGRCFLDLAPDCLIGSCCYRIAFLLLKFICLNLGFWFYLFAFQVSDWLETLVEEKGEDLYRLKGMISVNDSTGRFVFQVKYSVSTFQREHNFVVPPNLILHSEYSVLWHCCFGRKYHH